MISAGQLAQISAQVGDQVLSEEVVAHLREAFPGIHFTYCMDDDVVNAKPVFEHPRFNLYLVNSSSHCPCLTNDHDQATGVVLAEIQED